MSAPYMQTDLLTKMITRIVYHNWDKKDKLG